MDKAFSQMLEIKLILGKCWPRKNLKTKIYDKFSKNVPHK